jgi:hypothetical protein
MSDATAQDAGAPRIPDDLVLTGEETARLADRLLRQGHPFHAHEVLESAWKSGPPRERGLWQGLAQIAVGLTHARRGNARGAVALLRRGAERVRDQHEPAPYGIDIAAFLAVSDGLAARIEQHGLAGITAGDLSPGLLPDGR